MVPIFEEKTCHCQFFCEYMLPCQHLFHADMNKLLTENDWDNFASMFAESGMEVYASHETFFQVDSDEQLDPCQSLHLALNEQLEQIQTKYFGLEEQAKASNNMEVAQTYLMHVQEFLANH